ncbi:AAA family ATPase [Sporosarcina thermotolerans]|uniref:AAA family ATPase n=1 Tax=Sporosarcina thermotolerans TaxID=633404 RepID=A0AAW9A6U9_9BACL|nr:AAA family ATPase [Sporosarcina thermotolerans]MDW0115438.1 AAA family ATPase [Sporosarcina thermotolerans]WHT47233.1 AAA family ATPase [Sporosarcina thermotolerans]
MSSIIVAKQEQRQIRTYEKNEKLLIQEGGYISPIPNLWEDILIGVVLKKPILLKGPSGSGKTKLAQSISEFFQQPMHSVNCSVDLDAESLLGFKTIISKEGQTVIEFVEGPVVQAMKEGHILYIDEINMAKPETLPILHSVLDHRRMLTNPFTGEVIHAHEDFTVIAAINEGYVGTSPMNEALKNRFVSFTIPYLAGVQLREIIQNLFPQAGVSLVESIMNINEDLKKQVMNGLLSEEAASVRSLLDAMALAEHIPVRRAIQYAIAEKLDDKMEQKLVMELVDTWVK